MRFGISDLWGGVLSTPPWVSPESCLLSTASLQGAEILQGLLTALQGERWHSSSFLTRDHLKCCVFKCYVQHST